MNTEIKLDANLDLTANLDIEDRNGDGNDKIPVDLATIMDKFNDDPAAKGPAMVETSECTLPPEGKEEANKVNVPVADGAVIPIPHVVTKMTNDEGEQAGCIVNCPTPASVSCITSDDTKSKELNVGVGFAASQFYNNAVKRHVNYWAKGKMHGFLSDKVIPVTYIEPNPIKEGGTTVDRWFYLGAQKDLPNDGSISDHSFTDFLLRKCTYLQQRNLLKNHNGSWTFHPQCHVEECNVAKKKCKRKGDGIRLVAEEITMLHYWFNPMRIHNQSHCQWSTGELIDITGSEEQKFTMKITCTQLHITLSIKYTENEVQLIHEGETFKFPWVYKDSSLETRN